MVCLAQQMCLLVGVVSSLCRGVDVFMTGARRLYWLTGWLAGCAPEQLAAWLQSYVRQQLSFQGTFFFWSCQMMGKSTYQTARTEICGRDGRQEKTSKCVIWSETFEYNPRKRKKEKKKEKTQRKRRENTEHGLIIEVDTVDKLKENWKTHGYSLSVTVMCVFVELANLLVLIYSPVKAWFVNFLVCLS